MTAKTHNEKLTDLAPNQTIETATAMPGSVQYLILRCIIFGMVMWFVFGVGVLVLTMWSVLFKFIYEM
jgi:hypothetical protein